jgi:hypothetical protein
MDQALASSLAPSPSIVFRDGLGERRRVTDPTGRESVDLWYLASELSTPAVEAGVRDRVNRLAGLRHPSINRVLSVDRVNSGTTLAVISESAIGIRLSDLLRAADEHHLALDINTALCIIRQFLPAVAALYDHDHELAHGALAPERLVITPRAELLVVDYAVGAGLERLRLTHQQYWKDLRVALPRSAGQPHFDHRVDVLQAGVVALSLILGRALTDDEYPNKIPELVGSAWAIAPAGDLQPLPAGLRSWLGRSLQIDLRSAFTSIQQANAEFERMLAVIGYGAEPAHLERFLAQYQKKASPVAASSTSGPSRVDKPIPPVASGPRPVPSAPRPEPSLRVESPRIDSVPRVESAPRLAAVPRVDTTPRVETPRIEPRSVVEPRPVEIKSFAAPPRAEFTARSDEPVDTPVHHEPAAAAPVAPGPSRFDLTPRTDFSNFDFAPESKEVPDMPLPPPKSRAAASRKTTIAVAAGLILALTGGGMFAARRYAIAGTGVAETGTLTVTSNPTGAQVLVDRESKGITPTTLTLPVGSHNVELRGVGEPRTISVAIAAGAQLAQYIELANTSSTMGRLQIKTEPAGATVTIDALPRGTAPITVGNLDPGEHTVVLTSDAGTVTQTVTIEAGVTASLNVPIVAREVTPQSGWISVSSPVDVQLFENGRLLGSSQTDRIMVPSGTHQLELVNDALGLRTSRSVQVTPGKTATVPVKLPMGSVAINAIPWAEVWLDGNRIGETPIGNLPATVGNHEIVFRNPELGEKSQTVTVTLTTPARLSVDMRKK